MPDAARSVCLQALMTCTKEAVGKGNALSGTQFYSGLDGTHKAGEYRCVTR
ncbi:MAG TPA: hypothetical protein VHW64_08910 [Nocardioides sp.]|jgi:hypothetical protein|uniref:hypothetical protein n=1 Tax=Nocardioides sp. TaxID=35761 RepID=UPI002E36E5D7|nr:hypothetical protein [Nocardioides sp.]HEX3930811.1 hypothetical protein [Nocardioides sp.]